MFQQFTTRLVTLSAIATLSLPSAARAATVYQLDDGESNAAVGLTTCNRASQPPAQPTPPRVLGDLMWLNSFNARAGGEFIDSIDIVWGARVTDPCTQTPLLTAGLSNEPAKVFLYADTNNDQQLELLAEEDTIVQPPDTTRPDRSDVFSRIVFKQRQPVEGTFYIAALFPNQKEGQFPAALDIPNPTDKVARGGKSWLVFSDSTRGINPLPQPPKLTDSDVYTAGYWLLRANGSSAVPIKSVPESTSAISLVAIATLSAKTLLKRKSRS